MEKSESDSDIEVGLVSPFVEKPGKLARYGAEGSLFDVNFGCKQRNSRLMIRSHPLRIKGYMMVYRSRAQPFNPRQRIFKSLDCQSQAGRLQLR